MKYGIYGKYNNKIKGTMFSSTQLITVAIVIAVGLMFIAMIGNRPILRLLFGSIEADVMKSASTYFLISAWSYPFLALFNACAAIFRSMGNAKTSMKISVGMNLLNAVGNAIMIFGLSMGVAGAALSTFISRVLGAIGVWIAMVLDWIFRCALFTWRFVQGKWLEYKVI